MIWKRILLSLFYFSGALLLLIAVFMLVTVIPVDRTSYKEKEYYPAMMRRLDSLDLNSPQITYGQFHVGYAVENLVPPFPVATAGYGNRRGKNYTSIHDSIYVRTIVIDNGTKKVAVVSADLLIIPPGVTDRVGEKLSGSDFSLENIYLNATHTHNSIGNWAEGAAGLVYGSYNEEVVDFIADKIVQSVQHAGENKKTARFKWGSIGVPSAVRHRIDEKNGGLDSLLRVVEIVRDDSSKLVMVSFNAHPTCLYSKDLELSRDYPGELVDDLEKKGYDFAMFLSGAVGSHGCNPPEFGKSCLGWMSDEILRKFDELHPSLELLRDSALTMVRVPLALGEPQIKITKDWRLRPWVFRSALGEFKPFLTALRVGDILFLGTPCDFSGEIRGPIDSLAAAKDNHVIITSFNGQYIGYITKDSYYDSAHYETRLMNWYGPGNGAYLSECLVRLVDLVAE